MVLRELLPVGSAGVGSSERLWHWRATGTSDGGQPWPLPCSS